MSSTALKTLAVILVIAAAILGFVAFRFSQGLTQQQPEAAETRPPQPGEDQVLAVVAVDRIPAYESISQESVALVPISVEPPQYYTDVSEVVGRTPLRPIPVGTPVSDSAFGSPNKLAQAIPGGSQAMSLEISDVIAVGGFVKPGDMVDVLIYIRSSGREVEDTQARVLLEDVRLLAYEERLINVEDSGDDEDGRQTRRQRTAVLAVPEDDTTRVMLGASLGDLRLSLRGAGDEAEAVRVADTGDGPNGGNGDGEPAPEALSPQAADAETYAGEQNGDGEAGDEESEDKKDKEKVVTLKELAAIEEEQSEEEPRQAPRRPPTATIEVYQGTESSRINRPY